MVNTDNGIMKKECFVAMFDILGFGDLVKQNKLEVVAKLYDSTQNHFKEMISHITALLQNETVAFHIFSDTFLIYTTELNDKSFRALLAACDSLFLAGNENELPIRGSLTVGELIVIDGVEIGKPLVDLYQNERNQEWIGCWITEECINKISEKALNEHLETKSIVKYDIPLKDGKLGDKYAFNWLQSIPNIIKFRKGQNSCTLEEIKNEITFFRNAPSDWSVKRKHDNTKKFIDFILSSANYT